MSNPNTNPSLSSSPVLNQTKQEEKGRWWTGAAAAALGYAIRGPAPTPQSTPTTRPSPRTPTRQHDPNTKAQSKRSSTQEWAAYGDLEPTGCPPWFS